MRKKILFFASLLLMFFTLSTLTSCESKTEYSISMSVASLISHDRNVDEQTRQEIKTINGRMDNRLVEMFGKSFSVKCDEDLKNLDVDKIEKCNRRIEADDKIKEELYKLRDLKTTSGEPAVFSVTFYYYSGDKEFAEFIIE